MDELTASSGKDFTDHSSDSLLEPSEDPDLSLTEESSPNINPVVFSWRVAAVLVPAAKTIILVMLENHLRRDEEDAQAVKEISGLPNSLQVEEEVDGNSPKEKELNGTGDGQKLAITLGEAGDNLELVEDMSFNQEGNVASKEKEGEAVGSVNCEEFKHACAVGIENETVMVERKRGFGKEGREDLLSKGVLHPFHSYPDYQPRNLGSCETFPGGSVCRQLRLRSLCAQSYTACHALPAALGYP
ncbi:hypothetical protein Chor_012664 [Crotalus horridus]